VSGVIASLFVTSIFLEPQNVDSRILSNVKIEPKKKGLIAAVINTPKCGTGSLSGVLSLGFACRGTENTAQGIWFKECLNDYSVIRTHDATKGLELIQKIREEDGYGDEAECLIVTATRHPKSWAASLFVESRPELLCDGNFSYEWLENEYHDFIMGLGIHLAINQTRPILFDAFGTTVKQEMAKMKESGDGYNIIQNSSNDSKHGNCKILLLDMEHQKNWSAIFSSLFHGFVYGSYHFNREEQCPSFADKYDRLKERDFKTEELTYLLNGEWPEVNNYFEAYGYESLK
jgi:hypothetical protein